MAFAISFAMITPEATSIGIEMTTNVIPIAPNALIVNPAYAVVITPSEALRAKEVIRRAVLTDSSVLGRASMI